MALAAAAAAVTAVAAAAQNRELLRIIWNNIASPAGKLDDAESWQGGTAWEHLQYSEVSESDYLKLYVPKAKEPVPLLILVHGGGFIFNDCGSRQAQFMYRYFRDRGFACASVNYRLAQEAAYPAALEDVKAAVRFLRANAGQYGYDPDRIAIWGESAGGYLAVMAAVTADKEFDGVKFKGEEKLKTPVSGKVSAFVDYYGVMDLGAFGSDFEKLGIPGWLQWLAGLPLNANRIVKGYGSVEAFWLRKELDSCAEEDVRGMNPRYYIEKNRQANGGLRGLICHGDADLSVPLTQSERLYDAFSAFCPGENAVKYRVYHGFKHADDRFYSEKVMKETESFLRRCLGYGSDPDCGG